MQIKNAVVKRFQKLCSERKIKYNELATLSGVTPSTVYSMMDEQSGARAAISLSCVASV